MARMLGDKTITASPLRQGSEGTKGAKDKTILKEEYRETE
jgi:hypothetical protein